jgi:flavin reductase (DIM6/NTAB) family NADH-FMN oxidoreductase RutF
MIEINISTAQKLTSPNPFALISTQKPDGLTNLMAISWWTYVSNNPAMIAISLSNKGFSGECIRQNKDFGLSIVGEKIRDAAFKCGTCSGRNTDKAEEFGIPLFDAVLIAPKLVFGSRLCFECRTNQIYTVSDHTLYIGEVLKIHADPDTAGLYAINGYSTLGIL